MFVLFEINLKSIKDDYGVFQYQVGIGFGSNLHPIWDLLGTELASFQDRIP